MIKKIILVLLAILFAGYVFLAWSISSQILTVNYKTTQAQIADLNNGWVITHDDIIKEMGEPEKFEVKSKGDVRIRGEYFENVDSINCGVVISHGHTSGKTAMLKYADMFWDCGCDVVIYDHRGHGESDNEAMPTAGINEKDDHVAVTEWLKSESGLENHQIGWAGASWGAATVLMAGAYESEMAFIMADAPYQDWFTAIYERGKKQYGGIVDLLSPAAMGFVNIRADIDYRQASPILAAAKITEPVFLIHSRTDGSTGSHQSVNISKKLHPNCTFIHTEWGADHCKDINTRPDEYRALLYQFLEEKVGSFGRCGRETMEF